MQAKKDRERLQSNYIARVIYGHQKQNKIVGETKPMLYQSFYYCKILSEVVG